MMQMIPKWKITMTRSGAPSVVIFISDHYLSNVLRKLAEIEFDVVPLSVTIAAVTPQPQLSWTDRSGAGGTAI